MIGFGVHAALPGDLRISDGWVWMFDGPTKAKLASSWRVPQGSVITVISAHEAFGCYWALGMACGQLGWFKLFNVGQESL